MCGCGLCLSFMKQSDEWSHLLFLFVQSMAESITVSVGKLWWFFSLLLKGYWVEKNNKKEKKVIFFKNLLPSIPPIRGRPRDFMLFTHQISLFRLSVFSAEIFVCKGLFFFFSFRNSRTEMCFYSPSLKILYLHFCFILLIHSIPTHTEQSP